MHTNNKFSHVSSTSRHPLNSHCLRQTNELRWQKYRCPVNGAYQILQISGWFDWQLLFSMRRYFAERAAPMAQRNESDQQTRKEKAKARFHNQASPRAKQVRSFQLR